MYNLKLFGQKLREIRKSFGYTQKEISVLAFIDEKTLRRIENGENMPRLDTLDFLSPIYKVDLTKILLECKYDDFSYYDTILQEIELLIIDTNLDSINDKISELDVFIKNVTDDFYFIKLEQIKYFCEAINFAEKSDYEMALIYFIKAIRKTKPSFCISNYQSHIYNSIEIHILSNIAKMIYYKDKNIYIDILKYCIDSVPKSDKIIPRLYNSLGNGYNRLKDYEKALFYYNEGIKFSVLYSNISEIGLLYYGKGLVEYKSNISEFSNSFKSSIEFCELIGRKKLKNLIIHKLDVLYNIDYKTL